MSFRAFDSETICPALLGFAVSVAFWPGLVSAAVAPRWAVIAVGLPLVSWLDPRAVSTPTLMFLGATLAYAGLSLCWTPDALVGGNDLIRTIIFSLALVAGAGFADLSSIRRGAAWGVGLSVALMLVQMMMGVSPVEQAVSPAGLFYNRDFLAETAAILLVWAVLSEEWVLAVVLALPVALCGSRIALISAAFGLVIARPRLAWVLCPLALVAFATATLIFPDKLVTAAARMDIWRAALDVTLAGHGLGSFTATYPAWEYAHSDFLQSLYDLGIGALPLAAVFVLALISARGALRGALACLSAQCLIAFPLHLPTTTLLAGLLVGHVARRGSVVRVGEYVGGTYAGEHA